MIQSVVAIYDIRSDVNRDALRDMLQGQFGARRMSDSAYLISGLWSADVLMAAMKPFAGPGDELHVIDRPARVIDHRPGLGLAGIGGPYFASLMAKASSKVR